MDSVEPEGRKEEGEGRRGKEREMGSRREARCQKWKKMEEGEKDGGETEKRFPFRFVRGSHVREGRGGRERERKRKGALLLLRLSPERGRAQPQLFVSSLEKDGGKRGFLLSRTEHRQLYFRRTRPRLARAEEAGGM